MLSNRLYANQYQCLKQIATYAFGSAFEFKPGSEAVAYAKATQTPCVAVFGKRWDSEIRLPQKKGRGGYYVDWVLALLDQQGDLLEFIAVEVQTIDTTGSYRKGFDALFEHGTLQKTTAGLNWENVSKRILPQLIYKGQVLQREQLCKKGLFFMCPVPVYQRILSRLGGIDKIVKFPLQPASITFWVYDLDPSERSLPYPLKQHNTHSTTIYKLQEAFNNVTLTEENVYQKAILKALAKNPAS